MGSGRIPKASKPSSPGYVKAIWLEIFGCVWVGSRTASADPSNKVGLGAANQLLRCFRPQNRLKHFRPDSLQVRRMQWHACRQCYWCGGLIFHDASVDVAVAVFGSMGSATLPAAWVRAVRPVPPKPHPPELAHLLQLPPPVPAPQPQPPQPQPKVVPPKPPPKVFLASQLQLQTQPPLPPPQAAPQPQPPPALQPKAAPKPPPIKAFPTPKATPKPPPIKAFPTPRPRLEPIPEGMPLCLQPWPPQPGPPKPPPPRP